MKAEQSPCHLESSTIQFSRGCQRLTTGLSVNTHRWRRPRQRGQFRSPLAALWAKAIDGHLVFYQVAGHNKGGLGIW